MSSTVELVTSQQDKLATHHDKLKRKTYLVTATDKPKSLYDKPHFTDLQLVSYEIDDKIGQNFCNGLSRN